LLPNSAKYVAAYLGILQAGGVAVALDPGSTAYELEFVLSDAEPTVIVATAAAAVHLAEIAESLTAVRLVICPDEVPSAMFPNSWKVISWADLADEGTSDSLRELQSEDLAQIIYTSGTTGRPKGVMLSHANLAANCRSIVESLSLTADDSVLVSLPFYYSYGNSLLFTHLATGGRLVLAADFVFWNRVLDLMQDQRITGFSGVPSSFSMLLHKSNIKTRSFPDLRYLTCAGGGLPVPVSTRLRDLLPETKLYLMYGQTEATARLSVLPSENFDDRPDSIGRGIPGVTLDVVDSEGNPVPTGEVGEIVARGENIMAGYWRDPQQSARVLRPEGLRTGDLARCDENGYLYIVGRDSEIIKCGAHRIHPKEIEDVIQSLENVAEVAVAGVPDDILGESPVAYVVSASSGPPPTSEQIREHCQRFLSRHKLIREVHFVESLPKTASGKIRRTELARAAASNSSTGHPAHTDDRT
jgi:acyl-CoA synthetase (AMP-forming)/AMP-acid ligase II